MHGHSLHSYFFHSPFLLFHGLEFVSMKNARIHACDGIRWTPNTHASQLGPNHCRRVPYHLQKCMNATKCVFSNYAYFRIVLDKKRQCSCQRQIWNKFLSRFWGVNIVLSVLLMMTTSVNVSKETIARTHLSHFFHFSTCLYLFILSAVDVMSYIAQNTCVLIVLVRVTERTKNGTYNKRAGSARNQAFAWHLRCAWLRLCWAKGW